MKKSENNIFIIIAILFICISPLSLASASQNTWYVATNGSDFNGNGSTKFPFHTIQHAIEASSNHDTVVVMEGRYAGIGNSNLNFMGKAITVKSRDPDNDACIRGTIIDANGHGVVVRFINDEGAESIFSGFTLFAGNTSVAVRGVPGLFEFSNNARPTTRRLRIGEDSSLQSNDSFSISKHPLSTENSQISTSEIGVPIGERVWEGNNPFHQPSTTTDYHGSGDVDTDGTLTELDVLQAQDMADGLTTPCARADVDGNEVVNHDDVSLINTTLDNCTLPAWWTSLASREERNYWIDKIIAIDKTNEHPYSYHWFTCSFFCRQVFIQGSYYSEDLHHQEFNGGQTQFNVPMYIASVPGHCMNAILVGDDPLNFKHWRFIEAQTDFDVQPGRWNMPYGVYVNISVLVEQKQGYLLFDKVVFYVDETGWTLEEYSPDLLLTRPASVTFLPDNTPDLWNPMIVATDPCMILFERIRDDLSRVTDIHAAYLPFVDPPMGIPLVMDSQYSRLLDIVKDSKGSIHILYKGKSDYIPGIFYAELDPITRNISRVARLSEETRMVREGRIITGPGDEIHIFWLEMQDYGSQFPTGIYWTHRTGSNWKITEKITPGEPFLWSKPDWINRDFLRYYFDVAVSKGGDIVMVWAEPVEGDIAKMCQLCYDGQWSTSTVIDTANVRGVDLVSDSVGTLYLAYWIGCEQVSWKLEEGRGDLLHRTFDGSTWSAPVLVDDSGNACCPRMAAGTGGEVYMVWERKEDEHVVPVWSVYGGDGIWNKSQILNILPEADAWYPTVELLPDGSQAIAWSSRSPERVTIETVIIQTDKEDIYPEIIGDTIPEFPTILMPVICVLGTMFLILKIKKR